jgi:tRNA-dihydrouridine synthase A
MMDWTDRHCRYFHRLITRRTRLYTEMVTTGALLHGDVPRHLDFDSSEHPLALQLGGSEPDALAACAKLAQRWGYDEVNLNCGCPSERVQRGAFGACLMAEATLVRDGVAAMRDAVSLPITVKHRIGIDRSESYAFVRDFVGTVAESGCSVFIVHARNAWLKGLSPGHRGPGPAPAAGPAQAGPARGLSPKENREVPPLRYEIVHRLKADFPALTIAINGGLRGHSEMAEQLRHVDGVMVGRQAYHDPWSMVEWDQRFFDDHHPLPERDAVEAQMVAYLEQQASAGVAWHVAARHMIGLHAGRPGARHWRQVWSDHRMKALPPGEVARIARRQAAAVSA